MHRTLLTLLACGLVTAQVWSQGQPAAQAPQIETRKVEGTDNVYTFRNQNSQSMFIVTNDGVIVTDPVGYGRPQGGAQYLEEIRKITKQILAMDWERLIPGHPGPGGRLGTKKDAQDQLTFLQDVSAAVKAEAQQRRCWEPVESQLKLPKYASWPGYEANLIFSLRRYCALWGRGT